MFVLEQKSLVNRILTFHSLVLFAQRAQHEQSLHAHRFVLFGRLEMRQRTLQAAHLDELGRRRFVTTNARRYRSHSLGIGLRIGAQRKQHWQRVHFEQLLLTERIVLRQLGDDGGTLTTHLDVCGAGRRQARQQNGEAADFAEIIGIVDVVHIVENAFERIQLIVLAGIGGGQHGCGTFQLLDNIDGHRGERMLEETSALLVHRWRSVGSGGGRIFGAGGFDGESEQTLRLVRSA